MKLVFVSSTFKDMQYERDLLQTYAIPHLDDALREYGESAYFGDLRWGVNTTDLDSDEGSKKVLQVCLDQIDECKPYMIVLVGERYGWIPAQSLIDEACVLKGIDKIIDVSVTELEIGYGALLHPEYEGRILFYFRELDKTGMSPSELADYEAESPRHRRKAEELKERIRRVYPDHVRVYRARWDENEKKVTGLDGFLAQVQRDLSDVLLKDLRALDAVDWRERVARSADKWFSERVKYLAGADGLRKRYAGSQTYRGAAFTFYVGRDGEDASARLLTEYRDFACEGWQKTAFCFGLDKFSNGYVALLQCLVYRAECVLGEKHEEVDEDGGFDRLLDLVDRMRTEGKGLFVCLDNAGDETTSFLALTEQRAIVRFGEAWAMDLAKSFRMSVATRIDLPFFPFFPLSVVFETAPLSQEDAALALEGIVRSHHKELSDVVKDAILSKKQSESVSYLRSIVKRLMILDSEDFAAIRAMGDGMDNINKYLSSIVDATADDRHGVLVELVDEAKDRIDALFVNRLISVFVYAATPFSREELRALFAYVGWEFGDLNFALSVKMLEDVIELQPNGRYRIKTQSVEAVLKQNALPLDGKKVAEFMLQSDALRASAVGPAILTGDMAFVHSVILRSGVTSITDWIRYLIERGREESAVDLIVYLAYQEGMEKIKMVPALDEFSLSFNREPKEHPACQFLNLLSYKASIKTGIAGKSLDDVPVLKTAGDKLLFAIATDAEVVFAEEMIADQSEIALHVIDTLVFHLRNIEGYYDRRVFNRLAFVALKCLRFIGSAQIFEKRVGGRDYLENFRFVTARENRIDKMKAYYEYCQCLDRIEREDERYDDLIQEIVRIANEYYDEETEDRFTEEDYLYLAEITGGYWYYYTLCRSEYPQSLKLLQAEASDVDYCVYAGDEAFFEEQKLQFEYDLTAKAKALMDFKPSKEHSMMFLNAVSSYLMDVKFGQEEIDLTLAYFDCMAFSCAYEANMLEWDAQRRQEIAKGDTVAQMEKRILDRLRYGVSMTTYVGMLDVCYALRREGYGSVVKDGVKMSRRDDPFCQIVCEVATRLYGEDEPQSLADTFARYLRIRDGYLGIDKQATEIMDEVFADEGFTHEQ